MRALRSALRSCTTHCTHYLIYAPKFSMHGSRWPHDRRWLQSRTAAETPCGIVIYIDIIIYLSWLIVKLLLNSEYIYPLVPRCVAVSLVQIVCSPRTTFTIRMHWHIHSQFEVSNVRTDGDGKQRPPSPRQLRLVSSAASMLPIPCFMLSFARANNRQHTEPPL